MTLKDLTRIPVYQTRGLAADAEREPAIALYASACLQRMYRGDYGTLCQEDIDANNAALASGEGRLVCRYPALPGMEDDIYIICYFAESYKNNLDYENCMIMYCNEY